MEKTAKILSGLLMAAISAAAAAICFLYLLLPQEISIEADAACDNGFFGTSITETSDGYEYRCGAVPIKPVSATERERPMLVPCGTPFGIKLKASGVMAVSVTENSPAEKSGIKEGDMILSVNGEQVSSNGAISSAIQLCPDNCEIILRRKNSEKLINVEPYNDCGVYKIGIWVRDSAAGLGTMTYYDPSSGSFAGLGHPVSDATTGELMPMASGEITPAEITGAVKGKAGEPGELCGTLTSDESIGILEDNTTCGVFGKLDNYNGAVEPVPMAFRQEVHTGDAVILATIDGSTPKEYDIVIEHINLCDINSSKSMVIRITDPELLNETGGIVCGMSGSPIIQDGMLAGAVTHVFLNDPMRGYAIFCETMLEAQENR